MAVQQRGGKSKEDAVADDQSLPVLDSAVLKLLGDEAGAGASWRSSKTTC